MIGLCLFVGLVMWIVGFTFEAVGDRQKKKFVTNPKNQGKFIRGGLGIYPDIRIILGSSHYG